jgi:hypothetical protein
MRTLPLSFAALCALGFAFAPSGAAAYPIAPALAEAASGQDIVPIHSRSYRHCHSRRGPDDCHSRYGAYISPAPGVTLRFGSGRDWDDDDWRDRRRGNWKRDRDWDRDDWKRRGGRDRRDD